MPVHSFFPYKVLVQGRGRRFRARGGREELPKESLVESFFESNDTVDADVEIARFENSRKLFRRAAETMEYASHIEMR